MSILSRLFGKRDTTAAGAGPSDAEDYRGFTVTPDPIRDGGQYRVAARIEKDGKTHQLVRADTMASRDEALELSRAKARQMIDEQGERLFG